MSQSVEKMLNAIVPFYGSQITLRLRENSLIPIDQILKLDQISSEYIEGTDNTMIRTSIPKQ